LSVPSGRFARGTVLLACYFSCKPFLISHCSFLIFVAPAMTNDQWKMTNEKWFCTKTLILVSSERSVQYRERSDRMAPSILRLNSDDWFVECAIRSLRSRYCTVGMLLFVQTHEK